MIHLGESHYGQLATITSKKKGNDGQVKSFGLRLHGVRSAQHETNAVRVAKQAASSLRDTYNSSQSIADRLGISPLVLSRLAGTVSVDIGSNTIVEIGLGIKFSRRGLRVAGYVRE